MPFRLCCSARQRLQHNRLHVRRRGRTQRCEVPQHDCAAKRHFCTDVSHLDTSDRGFHSAWVKTVRFASQTCFHPRCESSIQFRLFTVGFARPIRGNLPSNFLINGDLAAVGAHGDPKPRYQRGPLRSSCHRATNPHMATNIHAHNEHPCAHFQANMPRRERFLTSGHKPGQHRTPLRAAAPRARRAAAGPLVAPFLTRPPPASAKATHDSVPPRPGSGLVAGRPLPVSIVRPMSFDSQLAVSEAHRGSIDLEGASHAPAQRSNAGARILRKAQGRLPGTRAEPVRGALRAR